MMKPRCSLCQFGHFAPSLTERGECRRSAPRTTVGQLEPTVNYCHPEMAAFPGVCRDDVCGEFAMSSVVFETLGEIVRETIFGEGDNESLQRTIDLCQRARSVFGIEREGR